MQEVIDRNYVKSALTKRNLDDDKFAVGSLLSICGSYGMAGAGIMSAKAALRSGVGLLRMIIPESIYPIMASSIYEAVFCPVKEDTQPNNISFIEKLNLNNAVVMGSGLSVSPYSKALVKTVLEKAEIPIVLDADGLNIVAENKDLLKSVKAPLVITPHIGEMSRLTGMTTDEINKDRAALALNFARDNNCIVVLKGHITVVASPDGKLMYNKNTGNPGMATGGSGDVLAGIIGSLIAQGSEPYKGAMAGVYIHGLAGDIAVQKLSQRSMLPTDMIEYIPLAFKKIESL